MRKSRVAWIVGWVPRFRTLSSQCSAAVTMRLGAAIFAWACCFSSVALAGLNVVVILDDSGSMNEHMRGQRQVTRMEAAKSALLTVLETLPADARVGVVLLNGRREGSSWLIPLDSVDLAQTRALIQSIRADGLTPLGRFMKVGADALLELRNQQHYGEYRLLIVTDGEAGDPPFVEQYLPDIMSRGITVDVIGVDMRANHSLANQVNSYRRADDPESLTRAVQEVFAETSDQADDTDESDFELLEGIPADVARAAILALGAQEDPPIGERDESAERTATGGPDRQPDRTSSRLPAGTPTTPGPAPPDGVRRWSITTWILFIAVAYLAMRIFRRSLRTSRRKR